MSSLSSFTKRQASQFNNSEMADGSWRYCLFFSRGWSFWGSWFSGEKAQLSMLVSIVGKKKGLNIKVCHFFSCV